jgi:uncharacterized membrane protein YeaQ/YmgE (transglycosylase-associated protein family)
VRSAIDIGAVVATLVAGGLYVAVIASQDEPVGLATWIVCGSVGAAAGTALAGALARRRRLRAVLFFCTAVVDLFWGLLGALSIGVAFVPGAVLAFVAARQRD